MSIFSPDGRLRPVRYLRIAALVDAGAAEVAEALLALEGFAIEILDETTLMKPPPGKVGLVAYAGADDAAALARVRGALAGGGVAAEVSSSESDEDEWRDRWKAYFKPRRVGPFVLVPSWETYAPAPGDLVIDIDPGRAFGTGGHASTRLCLEAIGRATRCASFLDVGCGSGVLAVACALRFPEARGLAVDVDPEALAVTVENATKNRVAGRVAVAAAPLPDDGRAFDLVLANIQLEVIVALAPELGRRTAPGGRLVLSGLLVEQAAEAARALAAHGLAVAETHDDEGWRAVEMVRR